MIKYNSVFYDSDVRYFSNLISKLMSLREELIKIGLDPAWSVIRGWEYSKLITMATPKKGDKVLDIGSATSVLPFYFSKNGCECYAVDIETPKQSTIDHCKKNGITYKKASIFELPFEDNYFDTICSVCVLEHIYPWKNDEDVVKETIKAFREINRVLKPGGITGHSCDFYVKDFNTWRTYHKDLLYQIIDGIKDTLKPIDEPNYEIDKPFDYYINNSTVYLDKEQREQKHLKYLKMGVVPENLFTCASLILKKE